MNSFEDILIERKKLSIKAIFFERYNKIDPPVKAKGFGSDEWKEDMFSIYVYGFENSELILHSESNAGDKLTIYMNPITGKFRSHIW